MTPTHIPHTIRPETIERALGMADIHGLPIDQLITDALTAYSAMHAEDLVPARAAAVAHNQRMAYALHNLAAHLGHPLADTRGMATNDTTGAVSVLLGDEELQLIPPHWEPPPPPYGTARQG